MVTPLVTGSHLFAGLACCSTVDTMITSVYRGFWVTSRRSYVKVDSDPAFRPGLLCLSLCNNDRCPRTLSVRSCRLSSATAVRLVLAGYDALRAVFFDAIHAVFPLGLSAG